MTEIAVAAFRPIVEAWVATFPTPEQAYRLLGMRSGEPADTWRRRFSTGKNRWWSKTTISASRVDEFLTLAELTHLYGNLDPVMWQPGPRKRCGHCKASLPAGQFTRDKNRLDGLSCWCRSCKAAGQRRYRQAHLEELRAFDRRREQRTPHHRRPQHALRIQPRREQARMDASQVAAAYRLYASGLSTVQLGEKLWRRFGYGRPVNCRVALIRAFHRDGYKLRSRSEACRLLRARQRTAAA